MNKYIFLWTMSLGWDGLKVCKEKSVPMPACGSDKIKRVDGRWSRQTLINKARQFAKEKRGVVGYSVGFLTCHDPKNEYKQSIVKFLKV